MSAKKESVKEPVKLENYLAGKPLNDDMRRLMEGEEVGEEESNPQHKTFADGTPITKQERGHLKRLEASAGWQVLFKLLDTGLQHQEDSARRNSMVSPLSRKDEIAEMWAELAADKRARDRIKSLVEAEVAKLKDTKK